MSFPLAPSTGCIGRNEENLDFAPKWDIMIVRMEVNSFVKAKYFILKKTSYKDDGWFVPEEADKLRPKKPNPGTDLISVQVVGSGEIAIFHTGIDAGDLIVPQD